MWTLFYRHWLELRWHVFFVCVVMLVAAIGFGFAVAGAVPYFARTGKLTQEIARYEALRSMIAEPRLVSWAVHTLIVAFFSLFLIGLFHGTGFEAGNTGKGLRVGHPSVYFTLSLPASRERLVGTRITATVATLALVLTVSLTTHYVVLLVIGQPLPFTAMALTSLLGVVVGFGLIALGAFLSLVSEGFPAGLGVFAVTMTLWLTQRGWNGLLQLVSGSSPATAAAVAAAGLLLVAGCLVLARRKEL